MVRVFAYDLIGLLLGGLIGILVIISLDFSALWIVLMTLYMGGAIGIGIACILNAQLPTPPFAERMVAKMLAEDLEKSPQLRFYGSILLTVTLAPAIASLFPKERYDNIVD